MLVLGLGLALVIGVTAIWLLRADYSDPDYWKSLGYPGVVFLSFLGSVSMVLPVPALIAQCGVSTFLHPLVLGLLAGAGEAVGEVSGYAVGYGGGSVVEKRSFYPKVKRWMERRGSVAVFLVCAIPNPFVDVVGVAAGGVRFPIRRFLLAAWVGKTVKGLMVAYTCHYGIEQLPWVS